MTEQKEKTRVFVYGDQAWDDPGQEYDNEAVRDHLKTFFPELAQATIETRDLDDGRQEVRFVKRAGMKGIEAAYWTCPQCGQIVQFDEGHVCPTGGTGEIGDNWRCPECHQLVGPGGYHVCRPAQPPIAPAIGEYIWHCPDCNNVVPVGTIHICPKTMSQIADYLKRIAIALEELAAKG